MILALGEAGAVDDGGVVQLVGEDEVFLAEDGADGAGVGGEAGLEDDAGFDVLERGDLFFELHVDAHGAGDGAHGAGADAVLRDGRGGGFAELGVVAEAEVVVAGEVDDLAAVVGADGALLVVEDAQAEVGAVVAEVVERGGEVGELGALGGWWRRDRRGCEWQRSWLFQGKPAVPRRGATCADALSLAAKRGLQRPEGCVLTDFLRVLTIESRLRPFSSWPMRDTREVH